MIVRQYVLVFLHTFLLFVYFALPCKCRDHCARANCRRLTLYYCFFSLPQQPIIFLSLSLSYPLLLRCPSLSFILLQFNCLLLCFFLLLYPSFFILFFAHFIFSVGCRLALKFITQVKFKAKVSKSKSSK